MLWRSVVLNLYFNGENCEGWIKFKWALNTSYTGIFNFKLHIYTVICSFLSKQQTCGEVGVFVWQRCPGVGHTAHVIDRPAEIMSR